MSSIFFSLLSHIDLAFSSLCVRLSSLNSFSLARFRHLAPAISSPAPMERKRGDLATGEREAEMGMRPFSFMGASQVLVSFHR